MGQIYLTKNTILQLRTRLNCVVCAKFMWLNDYICTRMCACVYSLTKDEKDGTFLSRIYIADPRVLDS